MMRSVYGVSRFLVFLGVAALLALADSASSMRPPLQAGVGGGPDAVHGGFNLFVYGNNPEDETRLPSTLDRLKALNATSLAIAFPVYQDSATATDVHASGGTPSLKRLERLVTAAQSRGLRVMLRPLIDQKSLIATNDSLGTLRPTSVQRWFDSYTKLILGYARLAETTRTEILNVGTELNSMENWSSQWVTLVSAVRAVYSGQVTYSINWFGVPHDFWDALDFIGVDAYFPLSAPDDPSVAELSLAWKPWLDKVRWMAAGKKVALTEVGVLPQADGFKHPWGWEIQGNLDYQAQARYYASACNAARYLGVTELYWWNVQIDGTDNNFDPLTRPAEKEARDCFTPAAARG
jgi:hypothetical protein